MVFLFNSRINETDYNGRVIDHELLESKTLQERLGFEKMLSKKKKRVHNHSWESDPFRLVEPSKSTPPFKVCISQKAMITIDFHSHLAHTEVIGLFGGSFDLTNKTLSIEIAYPCNSVSTSIQCEMDPISEMKAREYFIELGIRVVGWYHSHPTFVPDPSIRDIENQAAYQCLFRREDGIEPFIGAIVNPYHENQISRISFVGISDIWSCDGFRVPYSYDVGLIEFCDIDVLIGELESLLERYNDYEHKIDMSETFLQVGETQISRLDKMVASLDSHLGEMEMEKRFGFLNQIRELFQS